MYLNVHTYYSLRYGCCSPAQALDEARSKGVDSLAVTDINNTSAALDCLRLAGKRKMHVVPGVDFRNGVKQCFVALARNNKGWAEINNFLSRLLHNDQPVPERAPLFDHAEVIYPLESAPKRLRTNEWVGIRPNRLSALRFRTNVPLEKTVLLATATFRNKRDHNAHRLLRAIDNNTLLSKLPPEEQASPEDRFLSRNEMEELLAEWPQIKENTTKLLESCRVNFDFSDPERNFNQKSYTGNTDLDFRLMKKICEENLPRRYPELTPAIEDRLKMELEIIRKKGFVSYFLINWKILKYARSKGYFYVGRGSGANSIAAYLMRITDVDPVELDLYFERFINLYRKNPPDFDIDFSWADRDDITRFIFERFPHVTLLAAYSTFQYRAVVRELGKVFGLPKAEIDLLSEDRKNPRELDQLSRLVLEYGKLIQGFPSHLTIHAGGILISDRPIHCFTATFLPPKGYPTTHFDMLVAEDVGLYKFDILSQRGLGKIKDSLELIRRNRPETEPVDLHDLPRFKKDAEIKRMLREADAIGCFYVESPAMRMLMKKLQVQDYLGLVAASSVIRPGVSRSGMMRTYIERFRYPEKRKEAHPVLLDLMPETYGVMVYQEDVIKVAHYFAGLSLAEADVLRRGMSGKFQGREEFDRARNSFLANCKAKGYDEAFSLDVWRQVESFAGYAFAKGHSASYAVESYQSLFLKAYYPLEYLTATLNNSGGFYSAEHYLHEARMKGARVEPPCVNRSTNLCELYGDTIYVGLGFVKDLEQSAIERLLRERAGGGEFSSLSNMVKRVEISLEQLVLLVRIGAFRFTGKDKKALLWEAHFLLGHQKKSKPVPELFPSRARKFTLPDLHAERFEDAFDQMELLGFPLSDPFELAELPDEPHVFASELPACIGKEVCVLGYLVTTKATSTLKGERMYFGTFTDRQGNYLDTVHFPQVALRNPFRGRGVYRIRGKVIEEHDCYNIEVTTIHKLPAIPDPRFAENTAEQRKYKGWLEQQNNLIPTP